MFCCGVLSAAVEGHSFCHSPSNSGHDWRTCSVVWFLKKVLSTQLPAVLADADKAEGHAPFFGPQLLKAKLPETLLTAEDVAGGQFWCLVLLTPAAGWSGRQPSQQ